MKYDDVSGEDHRKTGKPCLGDLEHDALGVHKNTFVYIQITQTMAEYLVNRCLG